MATYAADYVAERSQGLGGKLTMIERTIDFKQVADYRASAGLAALASSDVYEVLNITAKSLVLRVGYDVTVAEGATATVGIGDGAAATGYATAVNLNSVGSGVSTLALTEGAPNTITGYSNGKYYTADDTIDLTLNHSSIDLAVVRVWALVMDCS